MGERITAHEIENAKQNYQRVFAIHLKLPIDRRICFDVLIGNGKAVLQLIVLEFCMFPMQRGRGAFSYMFSKTSEMHSLHW